MAGVAGFEPAHDGIKTRCLTAWRHPTYLSQVSLKELSVLLFCRTRMLKITPTTRISQAFCNLCKSAKLPAMDGS